MTGASGLTAEPFRTHSMIGTCFAAVARHRAVEARIIGDFDLAAERDEAGALIERDGRRMIEGAGVHPDAAHVAAPRALQRAVHQEAGGAGADQACGDAEIDQLALAGFAEIQLQQAFVAAVDDERVDFDTRVVDDCGELSVAHAQSREPQPLFADAAVEIAVPGERGCVGLAQGPRAGWIVAARRARGHLQMGDDGGDLAGGDVGIAVGEDHGVARSIEAKRRSVTASHMRRHRTRLLSRLRGRAGVGVPPRIVGRFGRCLVERAPTQPSPASGDGVRPSCSPHEGHKLLTAASA